MNGLQVGRDRNMSDQVGEELLVGEYCKRLLERRGHFRLRKKKLAQGNLQKSRRMTTVKTPSSSRYIA